MFEKNNLFFLLHFSKKNYEGLNGFSPPCIKLSLNKKNLIITTLIVYIVNLPF